MPAERVYAGVGPKGYGRFLVVARMLKIKERILSDRQLADSLRRNDLHRFVAGDIQPAHNTFNTLRKRLGTKGFEHIHRGFVLKAHEMGLLAPDIPGLPKHRRIIFQCPLTLGNGKNLDVLYPPHLTRSTDGAVALSHTRPVYNMSILVHLENDLKNQLDMKRLRVYG